MTGVYLNQPQKKIHATLTILRHFRRFIREGKDGQLMIDPYDEWKIRKLTKEEAQQKLTWLVNVAINRKAGIADVDDYEEIKQWRDQRNLHDIINRRLRVYQFETKEVRKRYSHLLAQRGED